MSDEYIEIDAIELQEVKDAQQQLETFQKIDELFIVAHETYIEFEEEIGRLTIRDSTKLDRDFQTRSFENKVRINIKLLSFLTAIRCYIEQVKPLLSQLLPHNSEGAKFWGEITAKIRAKNLDFRIMELVRNSAQHHALPVSYSKFSVKNDPNGEFPSQRIAVGFFLSRSALLAMKPRRQKDKETQCELLATDYQRFDLVLLTRSYMQQICKLNQELSNCTRKVLQNSLQVMEDLYQQMRDELKIDEFAPVVGKDEFITSPSNVDFIKNRHEETKRRYANKKIARLSHYPVEDNTYPPVMDK